MTSAAELLAETHDGHLARRLLLPYLNHAAAMYDSGYASRDDIDAAMRFGCGYPTGPLEMIDALGADRVATALDDLHAQSRDAFHEPERLLTHMAESGQTFENLAKNTENTQAVSPARPVSIVGVVGTGTMASGIIEVFAKAGFDVRFIGRSQEKINTVQGRIAKNLDKAIARGKLDENEKTSILDRVAGTTDRADLAEVDIVVEAIAEDLDIKRELFTALADICKPGAILATTTSSLSIQECARATNRPGDVIGMHFFNPATAMKLVEVVHTDATSPDVTATVQALCSQIRKHPVTCPDRAGFIVNTLLFPYLNDAIKWHEKHGNEPGDIDRIIKQTGPPMGPFELLDVIGNDVALAILRTLVDTFGHETWQPAPLLETVVSDGRMGRKSGAGFYDYS